MEFEAAGYHKYDETLSHSLCRRSKFQLLTVLDITIKGSQVSSSLTFSESSMIISESDIKKVSDQNKKIKSR